MSLSLIAVSSVVLFGLFALGQSDVKRIVAYSTGAQLGYMVSVVSLGSDSLGLLHLLNHGVFKALLFLACGLVIASSYDSQCIRSSSIVSFPLSRIALLIGIAALIGLLGSSGAVSKDFILLYAYSLGALGNAYGQSVFIALSFGVLLTGWYNGFLFASLLRSLDKRSSVESYGLALPVFLLGLLCVLTFSLGQNLLVPSLDIEFVALSIHMLPIALGSIGLLFGFLGFPFPGVSLHVLAFRGLLDRLIGSISLVLLSSAYSWLYLVTDRGINELLGGYGILRLFGFLSRLDLSGIYGSILSALFLSCILLVHPFHGWRTRGGNRSL